jgi:hypothetical protein
MIATVRDRLYQPITAFGPSACSSPFPVYAKGTSRTTVTDRRRNVAGFVVAVFNLQPCCTRSERRRPQVRPSASTSIRPMPPHRAGGRRCRVLVRAAAAWFDAVPVTAPHWSGTLKIGDANWQVRATPAAGGPLIAHYYRALAVLAAGLVITAFLAAYLWLASRNAHQLARVNRRVLELAQTDILTGLPNRRSFWRNCMTSIRASGGTRGRFRSSCSTSTVSRTSTIRSAMPPAMNCSAGRPSPEIGAALDRRAGAARRRRIRRHPGRRGDPRRGSLDLAAAFRN